MRTSITVRGCTLTLILWASIHLTAFSQGITSAAINGRVTATSGEALPGVNVIAVHNPSGTTYGTSTRSDGRYNLPGMRVGGPYTVTASLIGYQKHVSEDVTLRLSETFDLDFPLAEQAVEGPEIVVMGERASVFNASRTGAATNVAREEIDRLPTLARNFQDYYKVSPYFSPSTATGSQGNALGRNSRYNNIQVDGTNFNDLFGLGGTGTFGGQATTKVISAISLDAVEEFQLVVSPYDVRHSDFTGAGINAITRSGTNQYRASGFYYGRNENFAGTFPSEIDSEKTKLSGFTDYQVGGRVGGPIIENELFFFANAEVARFKQPFSRTFGNRVFGTNALTAVEDSLVILSNYLKQKYGYDPGSFKSISPISNSEKIFVRFDYNLSEDHKITARYNYLHAVDDNSPSRGRGATDIFFENGRYKLQNKTHSFALQLTSLLTNTMSNEFILGYNDQFDNPVFYGQPFPTLYITTYDTTSFRRPQNLILGSEEFRHYNELGQKVFEITNNFSWYLSGHTVTLGAKLNFLSFRNLFIPDGFGQYAYNSIARFLQDLPPNGATGFSAYTHRYSATANPLQEANWKANQYGFYLQDAWTASSMLSVTAGVRVDIPKYRTRPSYNKAVDDTLFAFTGVHYRTDTPPRTTPVVSPRIGFNLALDEERTGQIRGGAGIFSGRFPFVWVSNQFSNTGVDFFTRGLIVGTDTVKQFNPDPYNQPKGATGLPSAEVDLSDRNFKAPSIIRWNLAFDYKLTSDLTGTIEGIFSRTLNDVYTQNINLRGLQDNAATSTGAVRANGPLTPGGKIVGENREVWGILRDSTGYTTQWIDATRFSPGIFLVKNTDQGYNTNLTVQVQRSVPVGLNGTLAYTWGMAKDINSNNSTTASSQWRFNPTPGNPNLPQLSYSQWDRRHRVLATVAYRYDWNWNGLATTIGVFYNGQSGRPFSYMVQGDVNGDGRSDNDLVYTPKDEHDIVLVSAAGARLPRSNAAYAQLMAYINGDPYLRDNKGRMSERSGPREPWSHQIDLRLSQEIPTIAGQKFEITVDILNVLNLLNSNWGWVRNTGPNQTVNMLSFRSFETAAGPDYGKPRYQWLGLKNTDGEADPFTPDNILSRWQMQIGVRYTL
ncbi:MAG: TonB-dependent receptor [Ignavibacteriae bacterium]|nr:TonB-dependent receptor [Ignavibacteriota bacterium]